MFFQDSSKEVPIQAFTKSMNSTQVSYCFRKICVCVCYEDPWNVENKFIALSYEQSYMTMSKYKG